MQNNDYFDINQPVGTTKKFKHCKGDYSLSVTRFQTCWKFRCHRCHWQGTEYLTGMSPDQVQVYLSQAHEKQTVKEVKLPDDFTMEIPGIGLDWLSQFGITQDDRETYGIGYSKRYNRVILPVYDKGKLMFWQGRSLKPNPTKADKKYINIYGLSRDNIYFKILNGSEEIVLVEDILSCIQVSKAGADCISLLGAYLPDALLVSLKEYRQIHIWLDDDKLMYMLKMLHRFIGLGLPVRMINTDKDPKKYNVDEIKTHLKRRSTT